MKEIGVYIHMPFCKRKCYYCDFISYEKSEHLISEYIKRLNYEIEKSLNKLNDYTIKTVYIGGGTPSLCKATDIRKLKIKEYINEDTEFTIEINPCSVTREKLEVYKSLGVNRVSIGMQSTDDKILDIIGRLHTYQEFLSAYKLVREVGFKNVNVDLMIALPRQKLKDVENDLNRIIELGPEHISVYSLILEDETKLKMLVDSGKLSLPSEDEERMMYWKVKEILEKKRI